MSDTAPRTYSDLAAWWPLLSPPDHYAEEVADLLPLLEGADGPGARTLLELGAGGSSLAWHLKTRFTLSLLRTPSRGCVPSLTAIARLVG